MTEGLVDAISLPHLHLQQVINQVNRCEGRKQPKKGKEKRVSQERDVVVELKEGSGDEDGGCEVRAPNPPVVKGQSGLMSKANMMLTFLQGSVV